MRKICIFKNPNNDEGSEFCVEKQCYFYDGCAPFDRECILSYHFRGEKYYIIKVYDDVLVNLRKLISLGLDKSGNPIIKIKSDCFEPKIKKDSKILVNTTETDLIISWVIISNYYLPEPEIISLIKKHIELECYFWNEDTNQFEWMDHEEIQK